MLHYHPADCLEKDTCVLCGDDDIVDVGAVKVPGEYSYPYMLCTDCARLEGVTTVVEGLLTKLGRRKDWLKRTPRPPIPLPENRPS